MPKTKSFQKLYDSMKKQYLYEEVPSEYRKRYGKRYDPKDLEAFAIAVAKKKGIRIDKK